MPFMEDPKVGDVLDSAAGRAWPSVNLFTRASYDGAGTRFHDAELRREGVGLGAPVSEQVWGEEHIGLMFDAPIGWNESRTDRYDYSAFDSKLASGTIDAIKSGTSR